MQTLLFFTLLLFGLQQESVLPVVSHAHMKDPATDTIYFRNPSFEGNLGASIMPEQWISITPESTPDLLPGAWKLSKAPYAGKACLGLVTREDGTTEDICQELSQPLRPDQCYEFYAWLSQLPKYVGYNQACQLRIYGGLENGREELLDQSPLIAHQDWKQYRFQFAPKKQVRFITLVVWYAPGVMFRYKGNILVDELSPIVKCDRA